MKNISWHFSKVRPSRKNREAMQGEFFAANKNIASSLVREAIQNSLDARNGNAENAGSEEPPVKIRIYFSGQGSALPWDKTKVFFEDAWDHYTAEGNGLRTCPNQSENCKFLIIEDFNTTGLNGDIRDYTSPSGETKNPFYSFFRAEGQSNKSHTDRGRWGVGKFVFPKASRIKTFLGYTARSDDQKQFLVGQSILKSHKINGDSYIPDGWYGWTETVSLDGDDTDFLHMPIDNDHNESLIDNFRETFNIERNHEPGLSIVVPYIDEEISCDDIVRAVLGDYFWPILTGDLFVTIQCQNETYQIENGSLSDICLQFQNAQTNGLKAQIELAKWATNVSEADIKNNKIRFTPCGRSFFPKEAFGGRTNNKLGELLTFNFLGIGQIKTDLPVDKDGNPRWFCRERKWVKEFISTHSLKPNSKIGVLRQSKKHIESNHCLESPNLLIYLLAWNREHFCNLKNWRIYGKR